MYAFITFSLCFIGARANNYQLNERVVGGDPVAKDAFPFVAAIFYKYMDDNRLHLLCTGSIIHQRWILTAAHCVNKPWWFTFYADVGNILASPETPKFEVEQSYMHEKYNPTANISWNDISVLKLKTDLEWSPSVQPIPLASEDIEDEILVRYVGFGDEYPGQKVKAARLNQIVLNTMKFEECRSVHAGLLNIVDKETQICAIKAINKTLCFGDSGGPLVDLKSGRQVGIFTSMEDCTGRYPVLFSRISHYLPWIRSTSNLPELGV